MPKQFSTAEMPMSAKWMRFSDDNPVPSLEPVKSMLQGRMIIPWLRENIREMVAAADSDHEDGHDRVVLQYRKEREKAEQRRAEPAEQMKRVAAQRAAARQEAEARRVFLDRGSSLNSLPHVTSFDLEGGKRYPLMIHNFRHL